MKPWPYLRHFFLFSSAILAIFRPCDALEPIRISPGQTGFITEKSERPFKAWGVNYDHDADGRLLEDYWQEEWPTVQADFREMKSLGANVVRVHLQLGQFMSSPTEPNSKQLAMLTKLILLAEETGLYLDITGLGCYHKPDVPAWYSSLDEAERWEVQARFWAAIAETCKDSPAIFCYDLMNEPILPGSGNAETDWLAGEFGGKYFVQRLSLDLAGRTREEVAAAWVEKMTSAIRAHDARHMITVGVIPWALTFPGAKPIFYSDSVGQYLDFVSVHFYPETGKIDKALEALDVYEIGKPLVVEEFFPLKCSITELKEFITNADYVDGWIGFYWGKTIEEYSGPNPSISDAITKNWLEFFASKAEAF
jgi:hypothetical protein